MTNKEQLREEWHGSSGYDTAYNSLPDGYEDEILDKITNFWLSKIEQAEKDTVERVRKEIKELRPVLWNDNVEKHKENVIRYNTIGEFLLLPSLTIQSEDEVTDKIK